MAANLLLNGSFETDSNSDGLADSFSIAENVAGAPARELTATGAVFGAKAQRISHTATGDANKQCVFLQESEVGSFAAGDHASAGITLSGSATGCTVQLRVSAYTAAKGYIGIQALTITPTATPTRYNKTYASLPANTSYCQWDVIVGGIDTGDAFDLYLDGAKLEKSATATDFIEFAYPVIGSGVINSRRIVRSAL